MTSTKVFVHGNPETAAIWSPLIDELTSRGVDNIVTLTPPGFGAPSPAGWGATVIEYRQWLVEQLESIGGTIDLVGHDWGAGHVYGLLAHRPELVRSWAADCVGLLHPSYEWHDAARGWQTPEVGEQMVAGMVAMPESDFVSAFSALGMTADIAAEVKSHINDDMARCILALYRDASQPTMSRLGERVIVNQPRNGLVIVAEQDTFAGSVAMMEEMADVLRADVATLSGCGHWWMIQRPDAGASALCDHWDSVAAR